MRLKRTSVFAAVAAVALLLPGCGAAGPCDPGGQAADDGIGVAVAFDVGGIGDKSFNDAAKRGLDRAIADGLVSEADCIEPNATGSNRDDNVVNLADAGYDLVFGIGFAFSEGIADIHDQYSEQDFGVVDGFATSIAVNATNVVDLTFKEEEGSFLVGVAAAMKTQTGTVGFLGGQEGTGLIEKFQAGYEAGVRAINPDIEILAEYIGDDTTAFNDPTRGEALSAAMYDDGADVIYHAAGESGLGLFKAAVAAGPDALAIGVDSDQYLTASAEEKEHIVTSMIKRVDTAVYETIRDVQQGNFEPGFKVFGLAEQGVGYADSNPELLPETIQNEMDRYAEQIIDGAFPVPTEPAG